MGTTGSVLPSLVALLVVVFVVLTLLAVIAVVTRGRRLRAARTPGDAPGPRSGRPADGDEDVSAGSPADRRGGLPVYLDEEGAKDEEPVSPDPLRDPYGGRGETRAGQVPLSEEAKRDLAAFDLLDEDLFDEVTRGQLDSSEPLGSADGPDSTADGRSGRADA